MQIMFFSNCNRTHTQIVQAKPPEKADNFPLPFGVRRTVKSLIVVMVIGSLHPNEKPLSAELCRL